LKNIFLVTFTALFLSSPSFAQFSGDPRPDYYPVINYGNPDPALAASHEDKAIRTEVILDNPNAIENVAADEKPDSSPSSPPMATDDPGTPGRHGIEVNIISNCDRSQDGRSCDTGIDAAFGLGDNAQFRISKGYTNDLTNGDRPFHGVGSTNVGVKVRFYDKNGVQLATFPSYGFDDAARRVDADGNPVPSDGHTVYLPLIVSKEFGQYTVVANIGYQKNLDHAESSSILTSVAVGRAVGRNSKVMVEVANEKATDGTTRRTDVRIGWIKVIFPDASSKYQTSIFTSIGRTIGHTDDGISHITIQTGLQIARKSY
jgi:hypothetical protein